MSALRQRIRAVVFDLDDTLYPERDYVHSGYCAVAEHLSSRLGRPCVGPGGQPAEVWLWSRFLSGKAGGALNALNEHFKLRLSQQQIGQLVEVYRTHRPDIRPYDGVADLLGQLHGPYRLGIISDGYMPAQQHKLDALKIAMFFDAIVFTEQLGRDCWKPSPAGFESIRERLELDHDACAYVADNPGKDFVAPNALGWRTVQMLFPGQVHAQLPAPDGGRPQAVVHSPQGLCRVLREP